MANTIQIRRTSTQGTVPTTTQLSLGELAVNTYDGRLFFKKNVTGTETVMEVVTTTDTQTLSNKTLTAPVIGAASGTSLTLSGTATQTLRLSSTPAATNDNLGFLSVGPTLSFTDTDKIASFVSDVNSYTQVIVQNKNSGAAASADFIVNNDRLAGASNYGDFGINSSGFTSGNPFNDPNGTYLYSAGGTLTLGTLDGYNVRFAANNTLAFYIDNTNAVPYFGSVTSSIELTNPIAVFTDNVVGYTQIQLQNLSAATTSSIDLVLSTDSATDIAEYLDLGVNNSGYTTSGLWAAKDGYLYVQAPESGNGGNLVIGTSGLAGRDIIFHTAGTAANNERLRISDDQITTTTNVGINVTPATQPLDVNGNIRLRSGLYDSNNTAGTAGFQLTSTGTGVSWTATKKTIGVSIDGGGSVITTGTKGYVEVPYAGTIIEWKIIADPSGSMVFDIWKVNAAIPTNANTITASAKPTLTTAQRATSTTLTGWTTAVAANDVFGFEVESASTVTKAVLILVIQQA